MAATNQPSQGLPNRYVFKRKLYEYAQKARLPEPVYETFIKGPPEEPSFRSTVIVNDVRYDSLPGFSNRKAAEQSAAEVALVELAKSVQVDQPVSLPVHDTGLYKHLLQQYAQKMNYAKPMYQCSKDGRPGRASVFSCTVDIGGFRHIGGAAKTKKEAEVKAARTALLAIASSSSGSSENLFGHSQLTVVPSRKRAMESMSLADETANSRKPRKTRPSKRKRAQRKMGYIHAENVGDGANTNHEVASLNESVVQEMKSNASVTEPGVQEMKSRPSTSEAVNNFENGLSVTYLGKETLTGEGSLPLISQGIFENGKSTGLNSKESNLGTVAGEVSSVSM